MLALVDAVVAFAAVAMPLRARARATRLVASVATPQSELAPRPRSAALSFSDIATMPKPGCQGLTNIKFSPDDRYVTYLGSADATSLTRQLYAYDRKTGVTSQAIRPADTGNDEGSYTKEEQLRRERARIMSTGVTSYAWASKADRLLVPMNGALYVQDGVGEGAAEGEQKCSA